MNIEQDISFLFSLYNSFKVFGRYPSKSKWMDRMLTSVNKIGLGIFIMFRIILVYKILKNTAISDFFIQDK